MDPSTLYPVLIAFSIPLILLLIILRKKNISEICKVLSEPNKLTIIENRKKLAIFLFIFFIAFLGFGTFWVYVADGLLEIKLVIVLGCMLFGGGLIHTLFYTRTLILDKNTDTGTIRMSRFRHTKITTFALSNVASVRTYTLTIFSFLGFKASLDPVTHVEIVLQDHSILRWNYYYGRPDNLGVMIANFLGKPHALTSK